VGALSQIGENLASQFLDPSFREDGMAEHVGEDIKHQREVLAQALGAEASGVNAAAYTETGPNRLHLGVYLLEGAVFRPIGERAGNEIAQPSLLRSLVVGSNQEEATHDDRWIGMVLADQERNPIGQWVAGDVVKARERHDHPEKCAMY
jgi:hypothetical protein